MKHRFFIFKFFGLLGHDGASKWMKVCNPKPWPLTIFLGFFRLRGRKIFFFSRFSFVLADASKFIIRGKFFIGLTSCRIEDGRDDDAVGLRSWYRALKFPPKRCLTRIYVPCETCEKSRSRHPSTLSLHLTLPRSANFSRYYVVVQWLLIHPMFERSISVRVRKSVMCVHRMRDFWLRVVRNSVGIANHEMEQNPRHVYVIPTARIWQSTPFKMDFYFRLMHACRHTRNEIKDAMVGSAEK